MWSNYKVGPGSSYKWSYNTYANIVVSPAAHVYKAIRLGSKNSTYNWIRDPPGIYCRSFYGFGWPALPKTDLRNRVVIFEIPGLIPHLALWAGPSSFRTLFGAVWSRFRRPLWTPMCFFLPAKIQEATSKEPKRCVAGAELCCLMFHEPLLGWLDMLQGPTHNIYIYICLLITWWFQLWLIFTTKKQGEEFRVEEHVLWNLGWKHQRVKTERPEIHPAISWQIYGLNSCLKLFTKKSVSWNFIAV